MAIAKEEKLLPLVDAVEAATGQRPHLSTVLRWCQRGCHGVRLESRVLGAKRLTSPEAVLRFSDNCQAVRDGATPPQIETPKQATTRAKRSADKLAKIVGGK
jgi:Protein of unknown function (DUF1580)